MLYEIKDNNHPDWFNKVPWYNTAICSILYGRLFEDFIKNARIDRNNLMYYMISHDKKQPTYSDDKSSGVAIPIPKIVTTESL